MQNLFSLPLSFVKVQVKSDCMVTKLEGGDAKEHCSLLQEKCTSVDWRLMCLYLAAELLLFYVVTLLPEEYAKITIL